MLTNIYQNIVFGRTDFGSHIFAIWFVFFLCVLVEWLRGTKGITGDEKWPFWCNYMYYVTVQYEKNLWELNTRECFSGLSPIRDDRSPIAMAMGGGLLLLRVESAKTRAMVCFLVLTADHFSRVVLPIKALLSLDSSRAFGVKFPSGPPTHYRSEQPVNVMGHQIISFPMSSDMSERTSERTNEWPSAFVAILGCSEVRTIVQQLLTCWDAFTQNDDGSKCITRKKGRGLLNSNKTQRAASYKKTLWTDSLSLHPI